MSTRTEQLIANKLKEIEELKNNGLTQDIIDVLQDKRHSAESLYGVCKAFTKNFETKMRQANLQRARASKKEEKKQAQPIPA